MVAQQLGSLLVPVVVLVVRPVALQWERNVGHQRPPPVLVALVEVPH